MSKASVQTDNIMLWFLYPGSEFKSQGARVKVNIGAHLGMLRWGRDQREGRPTVQR